MTVTIDDSGISATDLPETLDELVTYYRGSLGGDLDIAPESPIAQILAIQALGNTEIQNAIVAVGNAHSLNGSTGVLLDDLFSLFDVERGLASSTMVDAVLTGVAGSVVDAAVRVADGDGNQYQTTEQVTLAAGDNSVVVSAVNVGDLPIPTGSFRIVTNVAGWETARSVGTGMVGRFAQSDVEYRTVGRTLAAQAAVGSMTALSAGVTAAGATKQRIVENSKGAKKVVQQWTITPHAVLVIAEGATTPNLTRAVENHRGAGVATITALTGAARVAQNITDLIAVADGTLNWDGTDYTSIDLSSDSDGTTIAATLTTELPVNVLWLRNRFVVMYEWDPDETPAFTDNTLSQLLGVDPDTATGSAGPWMRPVTQNLTVTVSVTASGDYPADGLNRIRAVLTAVVAGYGIGGEVWSNDLLTAVEAIGGTRVTAITVQHDSVDVSGVAPALDTVWALPTANLTVTVTT